MSQIPVNKDIVYTAHPYTEGYQESDHTVTWIFSDGTTGTGLSVTKQWAEPGFHTASVRAVNNITKKWAISKAHCNAEYLYSGDIIVTVDINPNPVTMGDLVTLTANASRDINPVNGYRYDWRYTGSVEDPAADLDTNPASFRSYSPQIIEYELTVTDLDVLDSVIVTGSLEVVTGVLWGVTSGSTSNKYTEKITLAPNGEMYTTTADVLGGQFAYDLYKIEYPGNGPVLETTIPQITVPYNAVTETIYHKKGIAVTSDNKIIVLALGVDTVYYSLYNTLTKTWDVTGAYAVASTYERAYVVIRDVFYQANGDIVFKVDRLGGTTFLVYEGGNSFYWSHEFPVSSIHFTMTANKRFYIGYTYNSTGEIWTKDFQDEFPNDGFHMRGTLNQLLGDPQTITGTTGYYWYLSSFIPVPEDVHGRVLCSAYLANSPGPSYEWHPASKNMIIINPDTDSWEGLITDISSTTTFINVIPREICGHTASLTGTRWVETGDFVSGFYSTGFLTADIDVNTWNVVIKEVVNTTYGTNFEGGTLDRPIYHPKLDRIFTLSKVAGGYYQPYYTKDHYPRTGEYDGEGGIQTMYMPDIAGDTQVEAGIEYVYSCVNSRLNTLYCPGMHCEWAVTGKATLVEPLIEDVLYGTTPELTTRLVIHEDFVEGDTIQLQARVYTFGGEVTKSITIEYADAMAYYDPITAIAYSETKTVSIPTSGVEGPLDPTRSRRCAFLEFYSNEGDEIQIDSIAQGVDWDPYMILYDSELNVLSQDDDGAGNYNPLIDYAVSTTGKYYISVMGYSDSVSGRDANVTLLKTN